MSTSAIQAGRAFIEFFAQDSTKEGFDKVAGRLSSFATHVGTVGASMSAVAGAALGGLGAALMSFSDFAGNISDASNRTGLGTEMLQVLGFEAERTGGKLSDVEAAARTMNKSISAAASGNASAQKNLAALGLTASQLLAMSPDERFKAIAQGISQIQDPSLRSAAAMTVFGKSANNIMEVLAGGAGGINAATREMQAAGLILSQADLDAEGRFGDAWHKFGATVAAAWRLIGASVAPIAADLLEILQTGVTWLTQLADSNRGLVRSFAIGMAVIAGVGAALMTVAGIAFGLSVVIGAIPTIVAGVGAAFSFMAAAVGFLLSPVGLAIASITALVALLPLFAYVVDANFFDGAGLQLIIDMFSELWRVGTQTVGGIFDALATGNWKLAGQILMAGLNLAFVEGWAAIKTGAMAAASGLLQMLTDVFGSKFIAIILKGFRAVIEAINNAAQAVGLDSLQIETQGLSKLIKDAEQGDEAFKRSLDKRVDDRRKAGEAEVNAAQASLDALTNLAAEEKEKRFGPKGPGGSGGLGSLGPDPVAAIHEQTAASGAFSAAAAARLNLSRAQFDPIVNEQKKTNQLLEQVVDNTTDLEVGDEFGD